MSTAAQRKERLHRLIDLALAYRRATRSELAEQLRRDRTRLYVDTDNPKLDLIVGLAEALEWSVDAVVEYIRRGDDEASSASTSGDFERLDKEAVAAHHETDFAKMAEVAKTMYAAATTPQQRGRACRLEGAAWEGQGRYTNCVTAFRRGLEVEGLPQAERMALQVNLAHAHYCLWDLVPARGICHVLLEHFQAQAPVARTDRVTQAFAYYVRGNAMRRMLAARPENLMELAELARVDLGMAEALYRQIALEFKADYLNAIAETCRGAAIEVDVELGRRKPAEALDEIMTFVSRRGTIEPAPQGDELETFGWWCDFGTNVAFRHLQGRDLQRVVAVLSENLLEIAQTLHNWALVERAVSVQYAWRSELADTAGVRLPAVLDSEDARLIAGTIERFPRFRRVGWDLIESAAFLPPGRRN